MCPTVCPTPQALSSQAAGRRRFEAAAESRSVQPPPNTVLDDGVDVSCGPVSRVRQDHCRATHGKAVGSDAAVRLDALTKTARVSAHD